MQNLINLIQASEDWLIRRILKYAKERGYTRYTSTLEEAWRLSIAGLSASLVQGLLYHSQIPDFGPEDDFLTDPLNAFGIVEAKRHRKRGVSLAMFLGLLKYYRQSYVDLIEEKLPDAEQQARSRRFLERSFDRMEIAFCQEWAGHQTEKLITELQAANRLLTNEKNSYLTFFESLNDPALILNTQYEIINLNHAAAAILHPHATPGAYYYSAPVAVRAADSDAAAPETKSSPLIGRNILDPFPWLATILGHFQTTPDRISNLECDGNIGKMHKYFEARFARMMDVSEKTAAIILILRDISDQKQMEAELKKSEERYKSLFENNHTVMLLLDPETAAIVDANPAACKYYGYDRDTLLQIKMSRINTLSEQQLFMEIDRAKKEKRNHFFFRHRLASGEIRDVEVFSGPIAMHGKQLLYSIIHDITQRKIAEDALQKSNQELDDFAYIASHDLREPLRAISNYSLFLLEDYGGKLAEEGRARIETIIRLCKREEDLINSLLHFSRVGRTDLVCKPVDLNVILQDIQETLRPSFPQENVQIHIPEPLPTVACDEIRVREIFSNLIINSIKYNHRPEKIIEVGARKEQSESKAAWIFYVKDNGIGIPQKHLTKIFTLFKRLHSRDKYGGGTGAGLTIVKKIVERHGGRIWVESVLDQGTTFHFTLQGGGEPEDERATVKAQRSY